MSEPKIPRPLESRHGHSLLIVRLIAVGKLFKASALIVVGFVLLHMLKLDQSVHDSLLDFVNALRIDEKNQIIHGLLEKSLGISRVTLRVFSVGTFIYAVLYSIEGFGLLFDQAWAEWMTVITTAGFIPLEIYEMIREIHPGRTIIFILNVLVLIYISMRLRWRHLAKLQARELGAPVVIPHRTRTGGIKP